MGVYVKGMEMPTTCGKCKIKNAIECDRWKLVRSVALDRHRDCPLVPVPPHGRLIDADALKKQGYFFPCAIGTEYAIPLRAVREAPTIIEEER